MRKGNANSPCIVPIPTDDPQKESGVQPPDPDNKLHGAPATACKVHLARIELATFSV
jgi:hypothetical protein